MTESLTFPGNANTDFLIELSPLIAFAESLDDFPSVSFNPENGKHLVIVGEAASGKTNLINVLAAVARLQGHATYGISGNPEPLTEWFATTPEEAADMLTTQFHVRELSGDQDEQGNATDRPVTRGHLTRRPPSGDRHDKMGNPQHAFLFVDDLAQLCVKNPNPSGPSYQEFLNYLGLIARSNIGSTLNIVMALRPEDAAPDSVITQADSFFLTGAENPGYGRYQLDHPVDAMAWFAPDRDTFNNYLDDAAEEEPSAGTA